MTTVGLRGARTGFAMVNHLAMTSFPCRPRRRGDLVLHELDGEALLYDEESDLTYRLNGTAYHIWQCCDGSRDAGAIARSLAGRYDVDLERVRRDVAGALDAMFVNGVLAPGEGPAS